MFRYRRDYEENIKNRKFGRVYKEKIKQTRLAVANIVNS